MNVLELDDYHFRSHRNWIGQMVQEPDAFDGDYVLEQLECEALERMVRSEKMFELIVVKVKSDSNSTGYDRYVFSGKNLTQPCIHYTHPGEHAPYLMQYHRTVITREIKNHGSGFCASDYVKKYMRQYHASIITGNSPPATDGQSWLQMLYKKYKANPQYKSTKKETDMQTKDSYHKDSVEGVILNKTTKELLLEQHPLPWTVKGNSFHDKFGRTVNGELLASIHTVNMVESVIGGVAQQAIDADKNVTAVITAK